ncbi:MAG: recombinase family protein, partial [Nitrosospira sp.]|nr:recombinase family protein [Nitrosospira sp.]
MRIGYARVSTQDQDNAAQIAALKSAAQKAAAQKACSIVTHVLLINM